MSKKVNVLIVEDSVVAQKIARLHLLNFSNFEVDIAGSGEEALKLFKKNIYDLIFMDIGLPGIDGLETTSEIRKLENGSRHTPIVAITANYDDAYSSVCLNAGMDDFMLKPLTKEKAEGVVNKYIFKDT